ncbi:Mu-like prophage FluMu I protein [Pandoraea anapnoica]|uniref:Mu-like prophage FluMu I protein n=1 Tax=Pandoraea anapnoica TaxID=2508301 RepID=A0A5E5AKI6_9BURK|nr:MULTISPECIES: phage protease [Pandoraea]VVE14881.1 Mu-like prophage FluMu I protein [Pandoraea iniqua]VVE73312.1 Mu-like prophage FluMu I protein [Pandoraea anapnoica]
MDKPLIASLSIQITPGTGVVQLVPAGDFRANDGRPFECAAWCLTDENAQKIVSALAACAKPMVIDWEHQSLYAAQSAQPAPAPAAGWFKTLEWRPGQGLYATDVKWTARAAASIDAEEYRYISPIFAYDKSGNVTKLLNAALTNNPALDDLDEVQLAAASRLAGDKTPPQSPPIPADKSQELPMSALMAALRLVTRLPEAATEAEAVVSLTKLAETVGATKENPVDLTEHLAGQQTQIAALTNATPDPAKFVPIQVMHDMQAKIAALTSGQQQSEVDGLVTAALASNNLLPSQEAWARELGKANIELLKQHLANSTPMAALGKMQTNSKPPAGGGAADPNALSAEAIAACTQLGLSQEDFAKSKVGGQ